MAYSKRRYGRRTSRMRPRSRRSRPRSRRRTRSRRPVLETKIFQSTHTGVCGDTPGVVPLTSPIVVGTSSSDRIGRKITIKKVALTFLFEAANLATYAHLNKIVLVRNKGDDPSPTYNDIYDGSNVYAAFRNLNAVTQYRVIKSKRFTIAASDTLVNDTTGLANQKKQFSMYLNINDIASWNFGSTTPAHGHLWAMFIGDGTSATGPTYDLRWRIYYTDT